MCWGLWVGVSSITEKIVCFFFIFSLFGFVFCFCFCFGVFFLFAVLFVLFFFVFISDNLLLLFWFYLLLFCVKNIFAFLFVSFVIFVSHENKVQIKNIHTTGKFSQ